MYTFALQLAIDFIEMTILYVHIRSSTCYRVFIWVPIEETGAKRTP